MITSALFGLALLGLGGDILIRGAVGTAAWLRFSPLFTGLVLVSMGTSMPELGTSLVAALHGSPGIAVGNVVGSNIANILLILALTAMIMPIKADPRSFRRDAPMLAVSTVVCLMVVETGLVGRTSGVLFLLLLGAYLVHTYRTEKYKPDASALIHEEQGLLVKPLARSGVISVMLIVAGTVAIIVGADLIVTASIEIATELGVSDSLIGLTVVAVGTSIPELAASIAAALKREADIAFGNIIGSNIFNVLGILGTTAVIRPIDVPEEVVTIDAWALLGVTGLLLHFAFTEAHISRREALIFLALYFAYLVLVAGRAI